MVLVAAHSFVNRRFDRSEMDAEMLATRLQNNPLQSFRGDGVYGHEEVLKEWHVQFPQSFKVIDVDI